MRLPFSWVRNKRVTKLIPISHFFLKCESQIGKGGKKTIKTQSQGPKLTSANKCVGKKIPR